MTTAPKPTTPADTLELFGGAYLRLHAALGDVGDAQWQMGRTPVAREDTSERVINSVSDPVWATLIDGRRLALREAVKEAERAMQVAEAAMAQALAILEAAHSEPSGASES